jgi:hypothetical protein
MHSLYCGRGNEMVATTSAEGISLSLSDDAIPRRRQHCNEDTSFRVLSSPTAESTASPARNLLSTSSNRPSFAH